MDTEDYYGELFLVMVAVSSLFMELHTVWTFRIWVEITLQHCENRSLLAANLELKGHFAVV